MDTNQIKYMPRPIGRILFYEVNNPIEPIEIECIGVKVCQRVFIYTKYRDVTYDNIAVYGSSLAGAQLYWFTSLSGKVFASIPLYIKNVVYYHGDGFRITKSENGSIIGVKGLFNNVSWILTLEPILNLSTIRRIDHINSDFVQTIEGKRYYSCKLYEWAYVSTDSLSDIN